MLVIYFILVLITFEEIAEYVYKRTNRYKNTLGGAYKLKNVPNGIEICNVGSGPGLYAIAYDKCELKGFNFSTAPQNFTYGFRLLKWFSSRIKENAIIIIIIMSPLSFGNNNDYKRADYSDKYYGILPPNYIDNYSKLRAIQLSHPLLCKILNRMIKRNLQDCNLTRNVGNEPRVINTWKKEFNLNDLIEASQCETHRMAFREKICILQDELDYCKRKGWNPILVTPPIPQNTRKYIGEEFLDEFVYKNVNIILKNNPGLCYLNYFDEKLPEYYFAGDIFMNEIGKKHFSEKLFDDIRGAGYNV